MIGSKLIEMHALLDHQELTRLRKFLLSPYFNEQELVVDLFDYINQFPQALAKQSVWERLYPGEVYDDIVLRRLMSELLGLLVRFLSIEREKQRPVLAQVALLQSLREKGATKLYEFYYRKFSRQKSPELLNDGTYLDAYLLESEQNTWLERSANRSGVTNLDESIARLDKFYLFNKLKYACTRLNNRNILGGDFQDILLEGLLQQLDSSPYATDPAILIYLRIYQMLTRKEETEHYEILRKMLADSALLFAVEEARHLYAFAMNYCIGRINKGDGNFLREIFDLYKESLARKILLENGTISPWDFKNIVVVGLRLSEFDWVEAFIFDYKDNVPFEQRENAFTYNLAKLHFYKREYSEVLKLLQKLEYEDVFYNLDAKVMLLKIYFESREIEALDSLIDSFRSFLRRNKLISDSHRTNYLNLLLFVKKLSRIRYGDKKRLQQIQLKFEATKQIADKDWLREKMNEAK